MKIALAEAEKIFEQAVAESGTDEITLYDRLIKYIGTNESPELQTLCAKARLNKGISLAQQGKLQNALTVFEDLQRSCSESKQLAVIGIATVSNESIHITKQLDKAIEFARADPRFNLGQTEREIFSSV
jgi:hypothetical protein